MKKYRVEVSEAGSVYWYKFGTIKLHREDGPAIELANGIKEWCLNGRTHREDGPAIEHPNGDKSWFSNGKLHRTDGPAIESPTGEKEVYYLCGVHYTKKQFLARQNSICNGKIVEIDGKQYKLTLVENENV